MLNSAASTISIRSIVRFNRAYCQYLDLFGNAIQAIGDDAKLPIEVYGADGQQIQRYRPQ